LNGYYYMSMEYLAGGTLNTLVKTGLELEEALRILEDVAAALHFAHSKGIIHRDVKPENIMFREDNSAVLMDFGIAKRKDASDGMTVAGAVMGTPKYMSPEQIGGKDLDGRCDLYALGIMFYEMLMKEVPYKSEDYMAVAMMHVRNPIPRLPIKFARAQHFLERLMAKNPEERFQTGEEVARAARQLRESGEYQSHMKVATQGVKIGSAGAGGSMVRGVMTPPKKSSIKQGLWEGEAQTKKSFFGDKYQFTCRIVSEDYNRFSTSLNSLENKLHDWYEKRKGACESIALEISVPAEDEMKVCSALRGLVRRGGASKFLHRVPMDVKLICLDTLETRNFRVKP